MPPTEQCALGAENKANVEHVDEKIEMFRAEVQRYMDRMDKNIEKLTNHYSQRPSWFITVLITTLVGLIIFLTQTLLKQRMANVTTGHPQSFPTTTEARAEEAPGP